MVDSFWGLALPPAVLGLVLTYWIERFVVPRVSSPWKRSLQAHSIHAGIWLLVFVLELTAFRRPWLAAVNTTVLFYVLVLINNAKFSALREPIIYQDVDYLVDVLKHPRLYLPFLGWRRSLLGAGGIGLALYIGVRAEPTMLGRVSIDGFALGLASLTLPGFLLLGLGRRKEIAVVFEPETDMRQLGLIGSLWRYAVSERAAGHIPNACFTWKPPVQGNVPTSGNLVVVQSESFFDVRRLYPEISPHVLKEFAAMSGAAVCHGRLDVPAWGANTVRSEFAFLSAIEPAALGVYQFNPYRKLARRGFPTLASHLKSQGYRTVCVHPYSAAFYNRNTVYPGLGFDEFIDRRSFSDAQKSGPFIGDIPLAERVCELLSLASEQPVFVFVITMENHGPLHLEKMHPGDAGRLYTTAPPAGCEDLTVYLRHLGNADRMLGMLREQLQRLSHPATLCWYGDHLPIMPKVYAALGTPDGKTDYLIWQKDQPSPADSNRGLKIEDLSPLLLQRMGLDSGVAR